MQVMYFAWGRLWEMAAGSIGYLQIYQTITARMKIICESKPGAPF